MSASLLRTTVGLAVVLVHCVAFAKLMLFSEYELSPPQRFDVAMILIPVTSAYFMAVVRSAIRNKLNVEPALKVSTEYSAIVCIVTAMFLGALLYAVFSVGTSLIPGPAELKRWLVGLETAFGSAFGLVAEDLFGRIEQSGISAKTSRSRK
jgi:hypothetical protein